MPVYAVWSDVVWESIDWPTGGVPQGSPYFGEIVVYGDVPEDAIPAHLTEVTDFVLPFGLVEVGNTLLTGSTKVFLHDGTARWDDGTDSFDTLGGFYVLNDPVYAYSTLLAESEVLDDGRFGTTRYLNAVETSGSSGRDTLKGTEVIDLMEGGGGNDRIFGGDGADRIWGGDGKDIIEGGNGSDQIFGGKGNDVLRGGENDDTIFGGAGRDKLSAGEGIDELWGENGRDILLNTEGHDGFLYGGKHNDKFVSYGNGRLDGGAGKDRFILTGVGQDEITGGAGADKFVFKKMPSAYAEYTLTDFESGAEMLDMRKTGFESDDLNFWSGGRVFLQADGFSMAARSSGRLPRTRGDRPEHRTVPMDDRISPLHFNTMGHSVKLGSAGQGPQGVRTSFDHENRSDLDNAVANMTAAHIASVDEGKAGR